MTGLRPGLTIGPARADEIGAVRDLMRDYAAGLGIDLCFQGFEAELRDLPGAYAPPLGALIVARDARGRAVGCVALRPAKGLTDAAELKRLYLRPEARGHAVGRRLAEAALAAARAAGWRRVVLDTLATMETARALYARLGFRPTAPYYDNPLPGVVYLDCDLAGGPRD